MKIKAGFILCASLFLALTSCTVGTVSSEVTSAPQSTPTTHSYFLSENSNQTQEPVDENHLTAVPTVASLFSIRSTSTPRPPATPRATLPSPTRDLTSVDTESFVIYDDELDANWEILDNPDADIDLASTNQANSGQNAIAFTPKKDFTTLFFAVTSDADKTFTYAETLGFSFWLNSGDDYIEPDELAVTVIGSNDFTYWNPDDTSADLPSGGSFSETRLYHLGLNGSIPPNTWVQIYVWIDNLVYDPISNYITAFYIKNDEGFYNTIYVDDVEAILLEQTTDQVVEDAPVIGTPESTAVAPEITTTPEDATPTAAATAVCVVSPPDGWVQYTIQPNDAISNLAVQAGAAPDVVISVNCLDRGGVLSVGKQIWLPRLPNTETPAP
jgi:hypothetical protein